MRRGTRRMWARRVLRAGWLLAPVLQFPAVALSFLFGDRDRAITTLVCGAIIGGVGSCTVRAIHSERVATNEAIQAALANNTCMVNLMPRRQAESQRPLTNRDLYMGTRDCEEAMEQYHAITAQQAVLARAIAAQQTVLKK